MTIGYTPKFKKQYKKLPHKFQKQFDERLKLFLLDPGNYRLRIHPLKGLYKGYWSMNVSGDLRAFYLRERSEIIIFVLIGTRSQLYG